MKKINTKNFSEHAKKKRSPVLLIDGYGDVQILFVSSSSCSEIPQRCCFSDPSSPTGADHQG
jgi:hypothetical protein